VTEPDDDIDVREDIDVVRAGLGPDTDPEVRAAFERVVSNLEEWIDMGMEMADRIENLAEKIVGHPLLPPTRPDETAEEALPIAERIFATTDEWSTHRVMAYVLVLISDDGHMGWSGARRDDGEVGYWDGPSLREILAMLVKDYT
jgi:hypothetical protein